MRWTEHVVRKRTVGNVHVLVAKPLKFDIDILIYLLTAIGLPPGGSCTAHIYTQTIHRTTQNKQYIEQHKNFENNTEILEECGPCPHLASYTLAFALQLSKKHGKTSVRVVEK
jgi:hypothetical protein